MLSRKALGSSKTFLCITFCRSFSSLRGRSQQGGMRVLLLDEKADGEALSEAGGCCEYLLAFSRGSSSSSPAPFSTELKPCHQPPRPTESPLGLAGSADFYSDEMGDGRRL